MKLHFEPNLDYQLQAIEAVCGLFHGQETCRDVDFDVFAGSGPSAHAVVARNPADGGNHRFVLSQLPEALALDERDQEVASECCGGTK